MIRAELQKLAHHSVIYGLADVVPSLVNFLLLPVFTAFLSPSNYGALSILLLFSVLTKIFFRSGLDSGFFRIYYAQTNTLDRKILSTTLFVAALFISASLFLASAIFAKPLSLALLGNEFSESPISTWIILVALDTFLNTFAFIPMNLFRIQGRPRQFTQVTLFRNAINIGLKLFLIVSGFGVSGVLIADVVASFLFILILSPTLFRNLTNHLSIEMLREASSFGLPKIPHGLAHQLLNLSDRKLIEMFLTLSASGIYHIGVMMGTGVKVFLAAFELAWGPFVFSQVSTRTNSNPAQTIARLATYAFAVLVAFGLMNAVFGRELLFFMAKPEFHSAHPVIPIAVLAYVIQGFFALTSIGIGISKKTIYLPFITLSAAILNIALNFLFIQRFGLVGAAWATVAGYALMAAMGFYFGNKHYPIPFEWKRLLRIILAASLAFAVSALAPDRWVLAIPAKIAATLLFPFALYAFGFFRSDEMIWLKSRLSLKHR